MTFEEIHAKIAAVKADYHQRAQDMTAREIAAVNDQVKELKAQLVAVLTEGANPCPACGAAPHGIFHGDPNDPDSASRRPFEVGCLHCAGVRIVTDDAGQPLPADKQPSFFARSWSREGAVKAWNGGPEKWDQIRDSVIERYKTKIAAVQPAAVG